MRVQIDTEHGSALLIALVLVAMVSLIGIMAVNNSATDVDLSYNQAHMEKAFYAAEAGAKQSFLDINEDNAWRSGYTSVSLGQGAFSVAVIDSVGQAALSDTVILRSTGEILGSSATVELWTKPEYLYPFKFGLFADKGITLDKNACSDSFNSDSGSYADTYLDEDGSLGTNADIIGSKDLTIGGDIFTATGGSITVGPGTVISGDTSTTRDSVYLDIIPDSEYDWAIANSNAPLGISGSDFTYNPGLKTLTLGASGEAVLQSGVYYFDAITAGQDSKITLAPGAQVTIYVNGDITLGQNSTVNSGGNPVAFQVYSRGSSLQFDQGNEWYGTFFGPNADIQYDQTTEVYGSLVGGSIQLDQGACFHYDRNLSKIPHGTTGRMLQVAWNEQL